MPGGAPSTGRSARRRPAARAGCERRGRRALALRGDAGAARRARAPRSRCTLLGRLSSMDLRIAHLYPDLMSIYGDRGNVLALVPRRRGVSGARGNALALAQRARWRDIAGEVRAFTAGQSFDADWPDLWFFG